MLPINAKGPKSPAETIAMAKELQEVADFAVRQAGYKPVYDTTCHRGKITVIQRVAVELTHPDVWTVTSNDREHVAELETIVKGAIDHYLVTVRTNWEACKRGECQPLSEVIAELREKTA